MVPRDMKDRTTIDLLQGTLGVLILKALSWGPMHGYGIARWIEEVTDDELLVEEGSLYPALHRLEPPFHVCCKRGGRYVVQAFRPAKN
jgi:hypothetical protein